MKTVLSYLSALGGLIIGARVIVSNGSAVKVERVGSVFAPNPTPNYYYSIVWECWELELGAIFGTVAADCGV